MRAGGWCTMNPASSRPSRVTAPGSAASFAAISRRWTSPCLYPSATWVVPTHNHPRRHPRLTQRPRWTRCAHCGRASGGIGSRPAARHAGEIGSPGCKCGSSGARGAPPIASGPNAGGRSSALPPGLFRLIERAVRERLGDVRHADLACLFEVAPP